MADTPTTTRKARWCFWPGQVAGVNSNGETYQPKGFALVFHPDLSANYFGDLVKKETGQSAQEYIQTKLIDVAKERIFDRTKSVSEIAYGLGFKYPQHFSWLFKQRVGLSPMSTGRIKMTVRFMVG